MNKVDTAPITRPLMMWRSDLQTNCSVIFGLTHFNSSNFKMCLFQDGMISAVEALEYGNLTLPEFLKADKDQNGFVVPSEFDSDLADE